MADELPWWGNLSVRLAKAVPGLAGLAREAAERHRLSSLAHDLALLAFWQDGVLAPLKHMSERGSRAEDIAEIAAWQARTAEEVARASDRLRRARADLVATHLEWTSRESWIRSFMKSSDRELFGRGWNGSPLLVSAVPKRRKASLRRLRHSIATSSKCMNKFDRSRAQSVRPRNARDDQRSRKRNNRDCE
jgi:hypothetical protein